MRAIVLNAFTGLDSLELAQVPDPVPRDGEQLVRVAAKGELSLRVAETMPLERFRDAYASLERGGLRGKIVFTP